MTKPYSSVAALLLTIILPLNVNFYITAYEIFIPTPYEFCSWDSSIDINGCGLLCFSSEADLYATALEYRALQRSECNKTGLILRLTASPTFSESFVMGPYWLDASVKIAQMELNAANLATISKFAFDTPAFRTHLHTLRLTSIGTRVLEAGMFSGLESLKNLQMTSSFVQVIEPNLLDDVADTLETLQMDQLSATRVLLLDGLTGGQRPLAVLTDINFRNNNFQNTITARTFSASVMVQSLNLRNTRIQVIGNNSFDDMAFYLEQIDLRDNQIATILPNVFEELLYTNVKIFLSGNPFNCDCSLAGFQEQLINYPDLFDVPTCHLPVLSRGDPITKMDLCVE